MSGRTVRALAALVLLLLWVPSALCTAGAPRDLPVVSGDLVHCQHGLVVSVHPLASRVGVESLREGGTAVDAAVATAFALAVTWPSAGNIGGGGYMLVVPPQSRPSRSRA